MPADSTITAQEEPNKQAVLTFDDVGLNQKDAEAATQVRVALFNGRWGELWTEDRPAA